MRHIQREKAREIARRRLTKLALQRRPTPTTTQQLAGNLFSNGDSSSAQFIVRFYLVRELRCETIGRRLGGGGGNGDGRTLARFGGAA